MDRRAFCAHACQMGSLATLGLVLQACGGGPTGPDGAPALPVLSAGIVNGSATLNIDAASPLANVGSAALVQSSSGNYLVARTGQSTFTALTSICTHEVCTITTFSSPNFECPCHGSKFGTSGSVVQGPASSPLRSFTTRFSNNVLTIG